MARRHHTLIRGALAAFAIASAMSASTQGSGEPVQGPIRFDNVSEKSGLDFVLQQHATPEKHMVETMAGGLAVFDYDGDGRPDIFFTNGAALPSLTKQSPSDWNRLYHNDGDFHFCAPCPRPRWGMDVGENIRTCGWLQE